MKKGNYITAALCAALGIGIIAYASGFPRAAAYGTGVPGPGLWPICVSIVMLSCVARLLYKTVRLKPEEDVSLELTTPGARRAYISMGILIVYSLVLKYVGFLLSTAVMMFIFVTWFSKYKWYISLASSVGCTLLIYLVFRVLLNVPVDFGMFAF